MVGSRIGSVHLVWAGIMAMAAASPAAAITPVPFMPIRSAGSGLCVDIAGASGAGGAAVVQSRCAASAGQAFQLRPADSGGFQIVARQSGQCLDVPGATAADGAQIIQWTCSQAANQRWTLTGGDGKVSLRSASSGLCLAIADRSTAMSGRLIQTRCADDAFQQFVMGNGTLFDAAQMATVQSVGSGLCLNVKNQDRGDNAVLIQWTCEGGQNSSWALAPAGRYYRLTAQHSGKCLTVPFGASAPLVQMVQSTCQTNSDDQLFALAPDDSGDHYRLVAKRSGQCIDVEGGGQDPGARIVQYPCGTQVNQSFNLIRPALAATWAAGPQPDLVAAAMATLPSGKIMFWSATNKYDFPNHGQTWTALYDPASNQLSTTLVTNTGHDMFCPGTTLLADGTLLVNGGNSNTKTSLYNPRTDAWTALAGMNYRRGYQANTLLPNGAVLTVGGNWVSNARANAAEMYQNGAWIALPGIDTLQMLTADRGGLFRADNHMWLLPVSGGRILQAGPSKAMHWLSVTGTGGVRPAGLRGDDGDAMNGTAVMYDGRRVLTVGGAPDYEKSNATRNANVIDTAPADPVVTGVAPMTYPRAYHNSVVLPNGQVIVVGGMTYPKPFTDNTAVLPAELWDPMLGTFQILPAMKTPRTYHGTATLMTDGRVIVAGGGLCGNGCIDGWINNHANTEVVTPPYLLDANGNPKTRRPAITSAPTSVKAGGTIQVTTDTPVSAFSLVRFGADTHTVNNDQRRIPLTDYAANGTSYSLTLPGDTSILLPGYYMLFVMDPSGTPSKAVTIQVRVS